MGSHKIRDSKDKVSRSHRIHDHHKDRHLYRGNSSDSRDSRGHRHDRYNVRQSGTVRRSDSPRNDRNGSRKDRIRRDDSLCSRRDNNRHKSSKSDRRVSGADRDEASRRHRFSTSDRNDRKRGDSGNDRYRSGRQDSRRHANLNARDGRRRDHSEKRKESLAHTNRHDKHPNSDTHPKNHHRLTFNTCRPLSGDLFKKAAGLKLVEYVGDKLKITKSDVDCDAADRVTCTKHTDTKLEKSKSTSKVDDTSSHITKSSMVDDTDQRKKGKGLSLRVNKIPLAEFQADVSKDHKPVEETKPSPVAVENHYKPLKESKNPTKHKKCDAVEKVKDITKKPVTKSEKVIELHKLKHPKPSAEKMNKSEKFAGLKDPKKPKFSKPSTEELPKSAKLPEFEESEKTEYLKPTDEQMIQFKKEYVKEVKDFVRNSRRVDSAPSKTNSCNAKSQESKAGKVPHSAKVAQNGQGVVLGKAENEKGDNKQSKNSGKKLQKRKCDKDDHSHAEKCKKSK